MIAPTQLRRLLVFTVFLGIGFSILLYRLVYIQIICHTELGSKAKKYTQRSYYKESRRGDIYDVHGQLLATSVKLKILCADPRKIGKYYPLLARALAPHLKMDEGELAKRIKPTVTINARGEESIDLHVRLKVRVPEQEWKQLKARLATLDLGIDETRLPKKERTFLKNLRRYAIFPEPVDSLRRVYPNGQLAAHVLGHVGTREEVLGNRSVFFLEGRAGIERVLNRHLQGVPGWRMTEANRKGRELVEFRQADVPSRSGLHVSLTLDGGLQEIVERALENGVEQFDPVSITSIIVRPSTGEILALANYPTFDPNRTGAFTGEHWRNRAITDQFEPGSTFKIVSISSALDAKVVSLNDEFFCENGRLRYSGHWLTDVGRYGNLSVERILWKSSNIGAFKAVSLMGAEPLYAYLSTFGFGRSTGLSLPGEIRGTLHPVDKWSGTSISRIPIGYEVGVTPIQMVMAACVIANDGRLMRPMIVDHLKDDEGNVVAKYHPQRIRQVISGETARLMMHALKGVVSSEGTGRRAMVDHYEIAGKTGTAKKAIGRRGYVPGKYYASFIGFVPADRPEVCICVFINEPKMGFHHGGSSAAPIFREIAVGVANQLDIRPTQFTATDEGADYDRLRDDAVRVGAQWNSRSTDHE